MNKLFKSGVTEDRTQTQLAYRIKYWPYNQLSGAAKNLIRKSKSFLLKKKTLLSLCNEELNKFRWLDVDYSIVWEYNNMPTEREWTGKSDGYLIHIELRHSPAVPEYFIAVLSFKLPSSSLSAHARGEMTDVYES